MAIMLDILMALVIGGMLLMSIISGGFTVNENAATLAGDVGVQQILISNAQLVEGEFRNMGMGVAEESTTVLAALDTAIQFLSDQNRDGSPERIRYWLGPVSELSATQNDSDRLLHRQVDAGAAMAVGTVTKFRLRYFSQGLLDTLIPPIPAADLSMIRVVEITMEVQNPYAQYRDPRDVQTGQRNALYSSSYWRQTRLASQNLKR
jgi:hypothetical protein